MATKRRYLWLLRHAKTVTDPPDGGTDFDRVLAPRGAPRRHGDRRVVRQRTEPVRRWQGPFPRGRPGLPGRPHRGHRRARAGPRQRRPDRVLVPDFYGAEPEEVLAHLATLDDAVTSVMVVGHNPTAHSLAIALIASSDKKGRDAVARHGFPTCALGIYRFGIEHWSDLRAGTARLAGIYIPPFG